MQHTVCLISSTESPGIDEQQFLLVSLNPKSVNGDVARE